MNQIKNENYPRLNYEKTLGDRTADRFGVLS
jgi:hypothetical protein